MKFSTDVVFWDIESHSVTELGTMPPAEYGRLYQWAWGEGRVHTTTDLAAFRRVLLKARMIVGANIINFDLRAVFGGTMAAVKLARQGRLLDTHVFAMTANPPPFGTFQPYTGGKPLVCVKPPHFRKWIKLDQQAFSLGVQGKTGDINDIADRFMYRWEPVMTKTGKPSMTTDKQTGEKVPRLRRVPVDNAPCCKFAAIPVDDPQFLEYAERDVTVVREVARKQLERHPYDDYTRREMLKVACAVQIGKGNRFQVDVAAAQQTAKDQHEAAAYVLDWLRTTYGFPVTAKSPMTTTDGKAALLVALADAGVPETALTRTDGGAPSFGKDSVVAACAGRGDAAEALGAAVATLAGQRSLAENLLENMDGNGRVHPDIFPFQRSGRFSTTDPGLTIWDPRYKHLLVADNPGEVLVEFDYQAADARAVAAMSGDTEFAKRFLSGVPADLAAQLAGFPKTAAFFEHGIDTHMLNALAVWPIEEIETDPKHYRNDLSKQMGHAWGYKVGPKTLHENTGIAIDVCKKFLKTLDKAYTGVVAWQAKETKRAQRYGYLVNEWGRRMAVEPGREFTQAPALKGQGATHEILCDGMMRCDDRRLRQIKVTVHDAFIASIPIATLEEDIAYFVKTFSTTWSPPGGQAIEFRLEYGTPAYDWKAAAH